MMWLLRAGWTAVKVGGLALGGDWLLNKGRIGNWLGKTTQNVVGEENVEKIVDKTNEGLGVVKNNVRERGQEVTDVVKTKLGVDNNSTDDDGIDNQNDINDSNDSDGWLSWLSDRFQGMGTLGQLASVGIGLLGGKLALNKLTNGKLDGSGIGGIFKKIWPIAAFVAVAVGLYKVATGQTDLGALFRRKEENSPSNDTPVAQGPSLEKDFTPIASAEPDFDKSIIEEKRVLNVNQDFEDVNGGVQAVQGAAPDVDAKIINSPSVQPSVKGVKIAADQQEAVNGLVSKFQEKSGASFVNPNASEHSLTNAANHYASTVVLNPIDGKPVYVAPELIKDGIEAPAPTLDQEELELHVDS